MIISPPLFFTLQDPKIFDLLAGSSPRWWRPFISQLLMATFLIGQREVLAKQPRGCAKLSAMVATFYFPALNGNLPYWSTIPQTCGHAGGIS